MDDLPCSMVDSECHVVCLTFTSFIARQRVFKELSNISAVVNVIVNVVVYIHYGIIHSL